MCEQAVRFTVVYDLNIKFVSYDIFIYFGFYKELGGNNLEWIDLKT